MSISVPPPSPVPYARKQCPIISFIADSCTNHADAIKSQARKHAWAGEQHPEYIARFMPYSDRPRHRRVPSGTIKVNTGTSTNGQDGYDPARVQSDSRITTLNQLEREKNNHDNNPLPLRSSTEPSSATPTTPSTTKKGKQTTGSSGDTLLDRSSSSEGSGLTQRLKFGRKSHEGNDDSKLENGLSKSTSTKSGKSQRHKELPVLQQIKAVVWSWPNVLLVCVPIGIALNYAGNINPLAIFLVCLDLSSRFGTAR